MDRPAIVIVTFKRQDLLEGLLASILQSTVAPWRIVVVDNEDSPATAAIMERFAADADALWGPTEPDPQGAGRRYFGMVHRPHRTQDPVSRRYAATFHLPHSAE